MGTQEFRVILPDTFVHPSGDITLKLDGLDFGSAIRALKAGKRVQRQGWNGKGMWLALTPGSDMHRHPITPNDFTGWTGRVRGAAESYVNAENPDEIKIGAHIDMRAADGSLVIGWLASQTDMLAEDWRVVE